MKDLEQKRDGLTQILIGSICLLSGCEQHGCEGGAMSVDGGWGSERIWWIQDLISDGVFQCEE